MSKNEPDYDTHLQQIAARTKAIRRRQYREQMSYQACIIVVLGDHGFLDDEVHKHLQETKHTMALKMIVD